MITSHNQAGFSAVELLITMFIGVAFIASGYQLYSIAIKEGGEARQRSRASNIAYDNFRYYSNQATNPCTTPTPTPTPTMPTDSGLTNTSISVTFTCPYGTSNPTSKIVVKVLYNTPQKEVVHASFITK